MMRNFLKSLRSLIADPAFQKAATDAIPNVPFELLAQKIRACKSKLDFQETFCYGILWKIAADHTDGLTLDHTAVPDKSKAYTYLSNHRDIILDSGFLSILLIDQGMDTVEIAIGDNLLVYPWIKKAGACQQVVYCTTGADYAADAGIFGTDVPLYALYH